MLKSKYYIGGVRWSVLLLFIAAPLLTLCAENREISSAQFLARVRTPPTVKTWAKLSGHVTNMKRDKDGKRVISKSSIYLGIRFASKMIFDQIVLGDDEIYSVGQPYTPEDGNASVIKGGDTSKNNLMEIFGIKPEDLTMSFIFWEFVKELPGESVSLIECRVFVLRSSDKKELARVYIGRDNFFPVKVEWSKSTSYNNFGKPIRTLEVDSFKKVHGLYLVGSLSFYGPGWRTRVVFDKYDAGLVKDGVPKDIFKK